jgi:epoxyqueuosine reductase
VSQDTRASRPIAASDIKAHAMHLGFDVCGVSPAADFPELRYLPEWIARGYAGEMAYLARTAARRADVRRVLPTARSVIVTATVYNVARPYSTEISDPREALIARYAWGDDYHHVIGNRLERLIAWMREGVAGEFDARAYVDTGPVQERVYAQHAGVGWIGKNTCVINPTLGSWLFLGEIITSLDLDADPPAHDQCGTCALCIDACPTNAILEPGVLDATKCLSYLTIELKDMIPVAQRSDLGSHVYGCDICQDVCPWNHTPLATGRQEWQPRPELDRASLESLWKRSDAELQHMLDDSAMSRARLVGLRRNLAVALGNAGIRPSMDDAEARPSIADPLVREHVEWAIQQVDRRNANGGRHMIRGSS